MPTPPTKTINLDQVTDADSLKVLLFDTREEIDRLVAVADAILGRIRQLGAPPPPPEKPVHNGRVTAAKRPARAKGAR